MIIRWTVQAFRAVRDVYAYILPRNEAAARETVARLYQAVERLREFPESGRVGRIAVTRELVVPGLPFIVVYRVKAGSVEILDVFHAARDWPTSLN